MQGKEFTVIMHSHYSCKKCKGIREGDHTIHGRERVHITYTRAGVHITHAWEGVHTNHAREGVLLTLQVETCSVCLQ